MTNIFSKVKALCALMLTGVGLAAYSAAPTVSSVTASQRYPRNGLVDITVTLQGMAEDVANAECLFVVTNGMTKTAIPVEHITRNGDDTCSGMVWTRKFIWDAKTDVGTVKIDDVELTVGVRAALPGVQLWEDGPYWAECNVGATQPEESGYYFWWGDTVGYRRNASNNGWVSVSNGVSFTFSSGNYPTYGKSNSELKLSGYIDVTGNLVAAHDAATAHLGAQWRMPTATEFLALVNNCTTTWTNNWNGTGVNGRLVTGQGDYASKSIFLPAAGYGNGSRLFGPDSHSYYWSSSPDSDYSNYAWNLGSTSGGFFRCSNPRDGGYFVRPVREFANPSAAVGGATTHLSLDCLVGAVSVTNVTAQQRYPWNGLVDISVTLQGTAEDVANAECLFAATNGTTKAAIPVEHITRNGDDTGSGTVWTRKFVWDAKTDVGTVKIDDVALTVGVRVALPGVQLWENGPYWAECNVGATKPEEGGYYFWWGDTVGYVYDGSKWGASDGSSDNFSFYNYNNENPAIATMRKDNAALKSEGWIGEDGNLTAMHDAATVHLGTPWRMPTDAEITALIGNCTTEWTTRNGVNGRLVVGKGAYSSKSIFLPAAGYGDESCLEDFCSYGLYWSSTPYSGYSLDTRYLTFDSDYFGRAHSFRYYGQPVRPVRESANDDTLADVGLTTHLALDYRSQITVMSVVADQLSREDGLVDVTVTLQGTVEDVANAECLFAATNGTTKAAIPVEHITRNGDDTGSGTIWTRKFIWDAKADVGTVKIDDVALTVGVRVALSGIQLWENGPYWAECNVGATQPEEGGYYFWWGDTVGYKRNANNDGWISVKDSTSFSFSGGDCPTYGKSKSELVSAGYLDSAGNLVAAHDAATAHLGAPWRMPTDAEFSALISNCETTWTTFNGVYGRLVTGKGSHASSSIFLPAAGYGSNANLNGLRSAGYYSLSSLHSGNPNFTSNLLFSSSKFSLNNSYRLYGQPVRPVRMFDGADMLLDSITTHLALDCRSQITVTSVVVDQRSHDDGLVDITVTLQGAAEDVANAECLFAATNGMTKVAIPVKHLTRSGADMYADGVWTRRFVWDAKVDVGTVKIDDVALTVGVRVALPGIQLWENGPYWAECNVGATKPEESGYYFWWGDTVGYKRNAGNNGWISVKDSSSFSFSSGNCPTYGKGDSILWSAGYIDVSRSLVAAHDAATSYLGAPWRMPTSVEFSALVSNCETTWTTLNGVYGRLVTGKGNYASNSIFLPAAGYGYNANLYGFGSSGYYSLSSPVSVNPNITGNLLFSSSKFSLSNNGNRHYGLSVRPVRMFDGEDMLLDSMTTHIALDYRSLAVAALQCSQRNGLVDVIVTLQGTAEDVANAECLFAATNGTTQAAIPVTHITCNGSDKYADGVWIRRFVWDAKADVGTVKIDDVELTVGVRAALPGVQLWENGPYWAECNVGATKPEECGYYFWWGDTVGYKRNANNDGWISVKDSTSFSFSGGNCPTYGKSVSELVSAGYLDSTGNLVAAHDAATAHLGTPWRMPTDAEFSALISNCTTTWTTRNGVNGRLVSGKGSYASRSIFLPAAGQGADTSLNFSGTNGNYWSSVPYSRSSSNAWNIYFRSNDFVLIDFNRNLGKSVRSLRGFADEGAPVDAVTTHLSLDCRPLVVPTVEGDEGATVTGDAETGFVIKPSEGKTAVEVTIPGGIDAGRVTVEVSPKVASVKPNGARVKIVSGANDITEFLNVPAADGSGVIDLTKATVKEEYVKEVLDVEKGAVIDLCGGSQGTASPTITTAPTQVGLFYRLREGETLDGMVDGDSKVGDGQPWSPVITVRGGNSGFYSIGVGKGE